MASRAGLILLGLVLAALMVWGAALWRGQPIGAPSAPTDRPAAPLGASGPASGAALRLAVFGTSLTANADWPEALAGALAECLGRPVNLARIARAGAGSGWAADQIGRVAEGNPDIVLIEFAINDADLHDGLWLGESIANHRALIAGLRAQAPGARLVLMTMNPAQGLRGLLRPRLTRYYATYRDLAMETDIGLIDLYPRWLALSPGARGLRDGLHPDAATARGVIVPVALPVLAALAGGGCADRG